LAPVERAQAAGQRHGAQQRRRQHHGPWPNGQSGAVAVHHGRPVGDFWVPSSNKPPDQQISHIITDQPYSFEKAHFRQEHGSAAKFVRKLIK
jgi:hypothetical protein